MPTDNMPMDGMDESYSGSAPVKPPVESVDKENEESSEDTALVSNKILRPDGEPLKAGEEVKVRIVKNYGDESEIAYCSKAGAEETPSTPGTDDTSEGEIEALDTGE